MYRERGMPYIQEPLYSFGRCARSCHYRLTDPPRYMALVRPSFDVFRGTPVIQPLCTSITEGGRASQTTMLSHYGPISLPTPSHVRVLFSRMP